MDERTPRSFEFDTRGFLFAVSFFASIALAFSAVHYGTAFAEQQIIEANSTGLAETELKLEEVKARRTMRSLGETQLLEKLNEYKQTLRERTIGTASIDSLSQTDGKFIGADLSAMKLYLYENGYAVETYDILSKGKRGSRWETPTGLYKIEAKETDHFSSIGEVHMPYSMQFFGNFFIHGWPYYPGGEPVSQGYSGGCIRLSTNDAHEVFKFADRDTPIFVWNAESTTTAPVELADKQIPNVSAKAFLVADVKSGRVFAEKNADEALPIASLSKLLTALVANETIHFDRMVPITSVDRRDAGGTPGSIPSEAVFTAGDLIYPLLMESNNSVAIALARYYGMSNFVQKMNDKAKAIGMEHTHMEDPSGISAENIATVNDLFVLMRYIHDSQSFILNVSRTPQKTIQAENGRRYSFNNFNVFTGNPQFLGGKTGYTDEAHETMVTVFEVPIGAEKTTVAIIVLGSADRKKDVEKLLAWFKAAVTTE